MCGDSGVDQGKSRLKLSGQFLRFLLLVVEVTCQTQILF